MLLPWGAGGRRTCVSERFFLGGIGFDGLRGFQYRGIGPTDNRRPRLEGDREASSRRFDALGGDVMCSLLGALRFYLPGDGFKAAGLRGQVFVNCGSVGPLSALTSTGAAKEYLTNNLCCSVVSFAVVRHSVVHVTSRDRELLISALFWQLQGAGIIWPTGIGKLELNVCRVLRSGPNSQVKHGIQFGITPTM